jgi:mannose-6-phosphate isomerase class I
MDMQMQKFRWSKVYESSEEELTDFLAARSITAERWSLDEFAAAEPRSFTQDMTLWCAEGSLSLRIAGKALSIQPGDGIHLPAETPFEITAGMSGCVCYEAPSTKSVLS